MTTTNQIPDDVSKIIDDATSALRAALEDVYFAGLEAGATKAEFLKRQVMTVLTGSDEFTEYQFAKNVTIRHRNRPTAVDTKPTRAPLGSVRPAIRKVLRSTQKGLTEEEIFQTLQQTGHTDIKATTVHSTLNKLKAAGETVKEGRTWKMSEIADLL